MEGKEGNKTRNKRRMKKGEKEGKKYVFLAIRSSERR